MKGVIVLALTLAVQYPTEPDLAKIIARGTTGSVQWRVFYCNQLASDDCTLITHGLTIDGNKISIPLGPGGSYEYQTWVVYAITPKETARIEVEREFVGEPPPLPLPQKARR